MSQPFTPTLFDISDQENWMKNLEKEGYVVIKNVLSSEEREQGLSLFKKDMATVSPRFDFDDSRSTSKCVPTNVDIPEYTITFCPDSSAPPDPPKNSMSDIEKVFF